MVVFENPSGSYDLGRWVVKGMLMNARRFAITFRTATSAQAIAMFVQAVLAGLALSGSAVAQAR
jgi:hypothetical protein